MTNKIILDNRSQNHETRGFIAQESVLIGEILQKKRKELKIEISEVSSYLRIKDRDVEGIENGDLKMITEHLYIPGLIGSYAKFLKIDKKIIDEKIKLLPIKSNVENKKHRLLNIGENNVLSPSKDSCLNFLLISILLFLVLLSLYNSYEDKSDLITNKNLILELENNDS
jgi:cytoskeletal protein RodZ